MTAGRSGLLLDGLAGIALYEGEEVFGDGEAVTFCQGDNLIFGFPRNLDCDCGMFLCGGFRWASAHDGILL